jgi:multimeric flavodoxin WrbA
MDKPKVRRLETWKPLSKDAYRERFYERFYDPAFDAVKDELEKVFEVAWDGYVNSRKSPRTTKAGVGHADPTYQLSIEWSATRKAIQRAQAEYEDAKSPTRILLVNGSPRSEHTCPGEISKTRRLVYAARDVIRAAENCEVDFLDLTATVDEPLRTIHPCKACVSTSMPLCHWPCSCYPNHSLGQTTDWMAELYPRWVRAHGVMIVCPVHWYEAPSTLKLMIDRLVCADGGNPDPTTTHGKDPQKAKEIELAGWSYPKHLAGRAFSVITHGDAAGPEHLRRILTDWLTDMGLVQAGPSAVLDRFIGYYEPYATSHEALDRDDALFDEVKNAALSLVNMTRQLRSGTYLAPDAELESPREK